MKKIFALLTPLFFLLMTLTAPAYAGQGPTAKSPEVSQTITKTVTEKNQRPRIKQQIKDVKNVLKTMELGHYLKLAIICAAAALILNILGFFIAPFSWLGYLAWVAAVVFFVLWLLKEANL